MENSRQTSSGKRVYWCVLPCVLHFVLRGFYWLLSFFYQLYCCRGGYWICQWQGWRFFKRSGLSRCQNIRYHHVFLLWRSDCDFIDLLPDAMRHSSNDYLYYGRISNCCYNCTGYISSCSRTCTWPIRHLLFHAGILLWDIYLRAAVVSGKSSHSDENSYSIRAGEFENFRNCGVRFGLLFHRCSFMGLRLLLFLALIFEIRAIIWWICSFFCILGIPTRFLQFLFLLY